MILQHYMLDVGSQEVNCYLMADEAARAGLLVDAGGFDPLIVEQADELGLTISHILLTHLHWDHVDALPAYLEQWPNATVIAPADPAMECHLRLVRPGEIFHAGPFAFEVLRTSGHTPESISYYCAAAGVCFVGDAIFAGSVGGTSDDALYEEQLGCLRRSILTLPEATELLSGHGPMTTVEIEKRANPFLQPGFGRKG